MRVMASHAGAASSGGLLCSRRIHRGALCADSADKACDRSARMNHAPVAICCRRSPRPFACRKSRSPAFWRRRRAALIRQGATIIYQPDIEGTRSTIALPGQRLLRRTAGPLVSRSMPLQRNRPPHLRAYRRQSPAIRVRAAPRPRGLLRCPRRSSGPVRSR